MKPPPVPLEWQIDVPLIVGKPLGISVMENTGVLTSVHKIGIIPEMNACHPDLAVQSDDRITEVNGVAGDAVQLLKTSLQRHDKALRLRICRPVRLSVLMELDGDDLGLVVEKSTGTVTAIKGGSASSRCRGADLHIGDRIVKVNGREPGEDDNIMPWLRLAVAGGLSPIELGLVRGSVPLDFFDRNSSTRGPEPTRARGGTVPRPEPGYDQTSETDTEDGPLPGGERAPPGSKRSAISESSHSDASHATDECAVPLRSPLPAALAGDRDRATVHPEDPDLFPPMFFNKTMSGQRDAGNGEVAPRVSRLARLRKLGERLILPHCSPFSIKEKSSAAASSSKGRAKKEKEFETPLPGFRARSASHGTAAAAGLGADAPLVLPIVSLQPKLYLD
jgi:hypothetical protein